MKKMKIVMSIAASMLLSGCTISFQNIDTHGTATDLVDETQSNEPKVSPVIKVPLTP